MKILIVEDELGVAQNLIDLLKQLEDNCEILAVLESVKSTVKWLKNNDKPDIGFYDIKLADGISFEIFEQVETDFPIIFTTAFDEYALRAFKVNSVDYLLKPIVMAELQKALEKYKSIYQTSQSFKNVNIHKLMEVFQENLTPNYKKNLLINVGNSIRPVSVDNIAYLFIRNELVFCKLFNGEDLVVDKPLASLKKQLNPSDFFQANRQFLISKKSVVKADSFFNRKLNINLKPSFKEPVVISKSNVADFKKWLSL